MAVTCLRSGWISYFGMKDVVSVTGRKGHVHADPVALGPGAIGLLSVDHLLLTHAIDPVFALIGVDEDGDDL